MADGPIVSRSGRRLAMMMATVLAAALSVSIAPAAQASATSATQITFTFNSPTYPWTASQIQTMQGWAAQALPLITKIYGPPSHSITVNVVQDPTISYGGEYDSFTNTELMRSMVEDVFIHETVHAYHDDDLISLATWEEGMTRAVEIQVATQIMPSYWDPSHSYSYDVYYDNVNKPKIGVAGGSINGQGDPSLALLRYQISSYAWTKIMIQNPAFMPRLNAALYAQPSLAGSESGLVNLAASIQTKVEGVPFKTWYAAQGIFNSKIAVGCFLTQRISQYTVDAFCRDQFGTETPTVMTVGWTVTGWDGSTLASGQGATNSSGWLGITASFPAGYSGRIKVSLSASYAGATLTDSSYRTVGPESGVFGVSTVANTGTMTFGSLDGLFTTFTVPVTNGAFSAPSLQTVRGRLRVTFAGPKGTVTRFVDKDASAYSLVVKTT